MLVSRQVLGNCNKKEEYTNQLQKKMGDSPAGKLKKEKKYCAQSRLYIRLKQAMK